MKTIVSHLRTQIQMAAMALVAATVLGLVFIVDRHQHDTILTPMALP